MICLDESFPTKMISTWGVNGGTTMDALTVGAFFFGAESIYNIYS